MKSFTRIEIAISLAVLLSLVGLSPAAGLAPKKNSRETHTVYIFLTNVRTWCALRDRATFVAAVNSDEASQSEADQAQVWFSGRTPTRIDEFRMDADGEWSTTTSYSLNARGAVTEAKLIIRSGDPEKESYALFRVSQGVYHPTPSSKLSESAFRRAVSVKNFPFWPVMTKGDQLTGSEKKCIRA